MIGVARALVLPDGRLTGLLSEEDAGRYLDLARGTLRNWRVQRRGPPFVRAGRRICYRIEDLQAWAEERLVDACGR